MEAIKNALGAFGITDLIDILMVSYLIYKAIKLVRETRAEQLVKGIFLLAIAYFVASSGFLNLKTMSFVLQNVFQIGIIALIILFQPELRRVLEKVGRTKVVDLPVFGSDSPDKLENVWGKAIEDICVSVEDLSATRTGALIVIERKTRLGEQIGTGVLINANTSKELFGNIFIPNTPLHDGAVIIRNGIIVAAACFLPKPQKEELIATHLGSRHRAAIGMSEVSDAVIIVVSEETGTISVAHDGELTRDYTKDSLQNYLKATFIPAKQPNSKERAKTLRKGDKGEKGE